MNDSLLTALARMRSSRIQFAALILLAIGFIMLTINSVWIIWDTLSNIGGYPPEYLDMAINSLLYQIGYFMVFAAVFFFSLLVLNRMETLRRLRKHKRDLTIHVSDRSSELGEALDEVAFQWDWKSTVTIVLLAVGFTLIIIMHVWSYLDILELIQSANIEYHLRRLLMIGESVFYFSGITTVAYLLLRGR